MNSYELNAKLRSEKSWYRDNTELVAVENVTTSDLEGQVRKNGIQSSYVDRLVESIRLHGQCVPITVDEDYVIVDGNHRLAAFRELMKGKNEEGDWDRIRVFRHSFSSEEEKQQYQLTNNDHLPNKESTEDDYVDLIVKKLQNGGFNNINWDNYYDDATNFASVSAATKKNFSCVKMGIKTAEKLVRKAVSSAPGSKFKNHMMSELVVTVGCSDETDWNGTKSKQESNGWWLLTIGNKAHIYPQLAGNALNQKIKNDNINNTVIFNCSNLEGMTGAKLDQWRKDMVAEVNKLNNANKVLKKKLIDEILFSPHKVEGVCKENGIFKVKKKSNRTGDFDADSIPTNGWK